MSKVDRTRLTIELVEKVKEIEGMDLPRKDKTKRFSRLATSFKNQLFEDKRRKEEDKIKLSSYSKYLSNARTELRKLGWIHHSLETNVARIKKKYPEYLTQLELLSTDNVEDAQRGKQELIKALSSAGDRLAAEVSLIDFNSKQVNKELASISKRNPIFSDDIDEIRKSNDKSIKKSQLVNKLKKISDVLTLVNELKIDHESIVQLKMDAGRKITLQNEASDSLKERKSTDACTFDYKNYIDRIYSILTAPAAYYSTKKSTVSPLIFALAAATGRRAIEVLFRGEFERKGKYLLSFRGQVKKRGGMESVSFDVYTIIESSIVMNAIQTLRKVVDVEKLESESSRDKDLRLINERVMSKYSNSINVYAKKFFMDENRTFHSTRSIYCRICILRFFDENKWEGVDEDIFLQNILGHDGLTSLPNYRSYKAKGFDKGYTPKKEKNTRLKELSCMDQVVNELGNPNTYNKVHNHVKSVVELDPDFEVKPTAIERELSVNRASAKKYIEAIGELAQPMKRDGIISPIEEKAKGGDSANQKVKPHFKVVRADDGWMVTVKVDESGYDYLVEAGSQGEAIRNAWEQYLSRDALTG